MKRSPLLALDMLRKEEIASLKGGMVSTNKVCGCICVGPLTQDKIKSGIIEREVFSSDGDCADCGASNAHRATNETTLK